MNSSPEARFPSIRDVKSTESFIMVVLNVSNSWRGEKNSECHAFIELS